MDMLIRMFDLLPFLGLLVTGIVLAQGMFVLYASFRRHRLALKLLQHRVEAARETVRALRLKHEGPAEPDGHAWNGFRKFKVERKVPENRLGDICSFYLTPHDGRPLPPFKPGQFLTFQLPIPDADTLSKKTVIRCYSLSDAPRPDGYRITIKSLAPGVASSFFHTGINEGDILDVKAPAGDFFLDMTTQHPVVLIGSGVGITPVLSMLNAIAESGAAREAWFFYGARNGTEAIMGAHLRRLAQAHENIHLHICYSAPGPDDVQGQDYHHAGRFGVDLLKRLLPSNNYRFYLCGPGAMMADTVAELEAWGVPEEDIRFEAFGPASVRKVGRTDAQPGTAPDAEPIVTFSRSGKRAPWNPAAASLLEFAEAQGVMIDAGCRVGNCQTCLTAIKEGDVQYIRRPASMPETGSCLPCISIPKGHVMLDV
jgi:ferredoxin-NADP reductase